MLSEFSLYAAHTVSSDCSQRTQWVQNVHSQHSEFRLYAAHTVSLDCTQRIPEFAANHTKADLNTFTHISLYTTNKKAFTGTVVSRAWPSLYGGSLNIMRTVSLIGNFNSILNSLYSHLLNFSNLSIQRIFTEFWRKGN